jgi:hypothetical protein
MGRVFKTKRKNRIVLEIGEPRILQIVGELRMHEYKGGKYKPVEVIDVIDDDDHEAPRGYIKMNAVLKGQMLEEVGLEMGDDFDTVESSDDAKAASEALAGAVFRVTKRDKPEGKRYFNYDVQIAVEDDE